MAWLGRTHLSLFLLLMLLLCCVCAFQVVRDDFLVLGLRLILETFGRNTLTGRLGAFFAHLPLTSFCGFPLLLVYFQVNTAVSRDFWTMLKISAILCPRFNPRLRPYNVFSTTTSCYIPLTLLLSQKM